jgi:hypothetical protein
MKQHKTMNIDQSRIEGLVPARMTAQYVIDVGSTRCQPD